VRTLPASWYHDPSVFERERRAVFARSWLVAGHAAELQSPGDYLATTIAGWALLIVRDNGNQVRAFHNVCRHRAGPLAWDGTSGNSSALVCRYHGWVYELSGRLRSARDFGDCPELDIDAVQLPPVQAAVWRGLVWVNLDPDAGAPADDLTDLAAETATFPMEEFRFSHEITHDLDVNWKTYADNYLEGYHIPLVHRELNREVDAGQYVVTVKHRCCVQEAPARSGAINSGRWLWCWPNLGLNLYPDAMNVERFLPLGPEHTRISYRYFARDEVSSEVERISRTILEEDRQICEAVQRNLRSGAYDAGVLSPRHEGGVGAFQTWVREALA
jgi:choline monooxygenase